MSVGVRASTGSARAGVGAEPKPAQPELVEGRAPTAVPLDRAQLVAFARASIARGSKSFAFASRLFDRVTRERVWLLYAWCRACDDIADAQDHGGRLGVARGEIDRIESLSRRALAGHATGAPAFDALGQVARETGLTRAMADDVIAGFALDAACWRPASEADLLRYCYHVAGAVGVMMAVVMGVAPDDADPLAHDTLDRASDLGIAFQLANIARDVAEDAAAGRCYLPGDWLAAAGIAPDAVMAPAHRAALVGLVARLEALAARYRASARIGARRLPLRSRWAVLAAAGIYGAIGRGVTRAGAAAWDRRVATGAAAKLRHVLAALARALAQPLARAPAERDRPPLSRRALSARPPPPARPDSAAGGTAARAR